MLCVPFSGVLGALGLVFAVILWMMFAWVVRYCIAAFGLSDLIGSLCLLTWLLLVLWDWISALCCFAVLGLLPLMILGFGEFVFLFVCSCVILWIVGWFVPRFVWWWVFAVLVGFC